MMLLPESPLERRRRLTRERQRRRVTRINAGIAVAHVEYNGDVLNMLERLGWLIAGEATDNRKVSRAIGELLTDTARRVLTRERDG